MQKPAADTIPDLAQLRRLYRSARFGEAAEGLTALTQSEFVTAEAALLGARVELRRGRPDAALAVLARCAGNLRGRRARAEAAVLKAMAFARLGDPESANAHFNAAESLLEQTDKLHAELICERAAAEWIERRLDAASETLLNLPAGLDADLALHVAILRGAIASASENLPLQGAILWKQ